VPLSIGTRLATYEVIGPLGAGGMGEVYRARDTKLGRDVAIKVLPEGVSRDPDRLARFEREARVLASLNHANIAAIHGLEEVPPAQPGGVPTKALILELVEGETLADRLMRGPIPLNEAMSIAGQMADALEAAHEKGIIHRDLKPSNVKITPDGMVKVLDFGVAKVLDDASLLGSTVTLAPTEAAVVLGTPAYMAPEQAQGRPVDKRADIWAFGMLLYEMMAGKRAFAGRSASESLAVSLTTDPDWTSIPPSVQRLLRRCLERDPRQRLRDIGDFRFLIEQRPAIDESADAPGRWRVLALSSVVVTIAAMAFAVWAILRTPQESAPDLLRLTAMLPSDVNVTRGPGFASSVALSPDGRTLVVAGSNKEGQRLYQRRLDRLEATPAAGTERGTSPFFSWDGAWIGFVADGRLKRVPAAGGPAVDIAPLAGFPAGASWGPDDRIVFAYGATAQLYVVNARGGTAELLAGKKSGRHPEVLPDGTVLFQDGDWIYALDRRNGRTTRLLQGAAPRYAMGSVIVSRGATLLAAPLDLVRHEVTGPVVPLLEGVALEAASVGVPRHYAISRGGTLAYVPAADTYALVMVHPDGSERLLAEGLPSIQNPQFSPDGRKVAVAANRRAGEPSDIWIYEIESGIETRLTFDGARAPVWMPDNVHVTYAHIGEGGGIYSRTSDGRGTATRVLALNDFHWLVDWTPDQRTLVYGRMEGAPSSIMALQNGESRRVIGPGSTWGGRLSRDGKWLAYYLLESGNFEVYVSPFPDAGTRWLIAEGTDPTWAPDGTEIYYRSGARLMAARIDKSAGVKVLSRRVLVEPFLPPLYDDYDIHPDGHTLVLVRPSGPTQAREVTLTANWFTELRRLTAASRAEGDR
jgi:serine/threonine protein kinase